MVLARLKKLVELKEQKMMKPTIETYKIIILITYTWAHFFALPLINKKTTVNRGWFTLNRELVLNKILRATMIDEQRMQEAESSVFCVPPLTNSTLPISTSTVIFPITTTIIPVSSLIDHTYLTYPNLIQNNCSIFAWNHCFFLDKLVHHIDLM